MDKFTPEQRSKIMSAIHSRDTLPEVIVRKWLFAQGCRFRVCDKKVVARGTEGRQMTYLIRTTSELEAACAQVRDAGVLALDTEFVWRNTYRPRLGIVQMGAGGDASWAVDVMLGLNPAALADLIADASVVKILHDARADELHVASGVFANRATVTAFVDNVEDGASPLSGGWRWEKVGREMAERFGVD